MSAGVETDWDQIDEILRVGEERNAANHATDMARRVVALSAERFVDATTDHDREFSRASLERAVAHMRASETAEQVANERLTALYALQAPGARVTSTTDPSAE